VVGRLKMLHEWDGPGAEAQLEHAAARAPQSPDAAFALALSRWRRAAPTRPWRRWRELFDRAPFAAHGRGRPHDGDGRLPSPTNRIASAGGGVAVPPRRHVSGSTDEFEGTLSEGRAPRAGWTAQDQHAERALDDGSGPAPTGQKAGRPLRSTAGDRPPHGPASRPRAGHLPPDEYRQAGAGPRALHRSGGLLSTCGRGRYVLRRTAGNDAMSAELAKRRHLGADPRSGNSGNTGRSRRSGWLTPGIAHDRKKTAAKSGRSGESWQAADHGARRDVDDRPRSRRATDDAW